MQKIILTSRKLKDVVEKTTRKWKAIVVGVDVDVASFMTSSRVIDALEKIDIRKDDIIIVPGNFTESTARISRETGAACYKGTKNLSDLTILLEYMDDKSKTQGGVVELKNELSQVSSADKIIESRIFENIKKSLGSMYEYKGTGGIKKTMIGKLTLNGIPRIMAEIVDAPLLTCDEIAEKTRLYIKQGADIIDIGMTPKADAESVGNIVKTVKSSIEKYRRNFKEIAVSIDTTDSGEILRGVEQGVDMLVSIDESNYTVLGEIENIKKLLPEKNNGKRNKTKLPVVLIPRNKSGEIVKHNERIIFLENLIKKINHEFNQGEIFEFIIDPILDPPNYGLFKSLICYFNFRQRHPEIPIMMGVGNVSELMDADSAGMNALLCALAFEIQTDIVLTPQYSEKAKYSVMEMKRAVEMMFISHTRGQPPKDLGIDLILFGDKKCAPLAVHEPGFDDPSSIEKFTDTADPGFGKIPVKYDSGFFKIFLKENKIFAVYYPNSKKTGRGIGFAGVDADVIYRNIIESPGISISLQHAAYLGKELFRAETALKCGKCYEQERELFPGISKFLKN